MPALAARAPFLLAAVAAADAAAAPRAPGVAQRRTALSSRPPAPTTARKSSSRCHSLAPSPSRSRARPAAPALLSRFRLRLPLAAGASPPAAVAEGQQGLGARRACSGVAGGCGGTLSLVRLRPGACGVGSRRVTGRLDSK
ncbi:uncharacterized protein PHA67_008985 [Liasis olivaceus]